MLKYVDIKDVALHGGLSLLATIVFVIALVADTPLQGIIVAGLSAAGFILIAIAKVIQSKPVLPQYKTKQGTEIFSDVESVLGNYMPTPDEMDQALDFFAYTLPLLTSSNPYLSGPEQSLSQPEILRMFDGAKIHWRKDKTTMFRRYWKCVDKSGLQDGKECIVHWPGGVIQSALFHELIHMIDEVILKRAPDYAHKNMHWWELIVFLKRHYAVEISTKK
jgi:hypothetical protein